MTNERPIDPPEDWLCDQCSKSFYPGAEDAPPDGEPVLCRDCKDFDG